MIDTACNWLAQHPGFADGLIVLMIVLVAAALALSMGRGVVMDDDEHSKNHW